MPRQHSGAASTLAPGRSHLVAEPRIPGCTACRRRRGSHCGRHSWEAGRPRTPASAWAGKEGRGRRASALVPAGRAGACRPLQPACLAPPLAVVCVVGLALFTRAAWGICLLHAVVWLAGALVVLRRAGPGACRGGRVSGCRAARPTALALRRLPLDALQAEAGGLWALALAVVVHSLAAAVAGASGADLPCTADDCRCCRCRRCCMLTTSF